MNNQNIPIPKKSLCRFYLRGLCIYASKDCTFAHGIWDLDYQYWTQDQYVEYDYHKTKDNHQKAIKGKAVYKNLYQYQKEKIYSLQEFSINRAARSQIRKLMNRQHYMDFMHLLEIKHPDTIFTEKFLVREFTRVGFNKILFGQMKINQIATFVCDPPDSEYFRTVKIVPPEPHKQNVILRRASQEQIVKIYKIEFQKIVKQNEEPIEESVIKKKLFTAALPDNVPPLNQILKDKKISLAEFLQVYLGQQKGKILVQTTIQDMVKQTISFLQSEIKNKLVSFNDVYNYLTKTFKNNNGNSLNQIKPLLVQQRYAFLFFPMAQFLYNPQIKTQIFKDLSKTPCTCNFQKPYPTQELLLQSLNIEEGLVQGQSYDIYNYESLIKCASHILKSKILGVDLQGRLRKGGFVEMIQLNNGSNTFLIDIWHMNQVGDFETFWLTRKILRNVMVNPEIIKIFHDCRHDSIGLHEMLETCIINVFDTSACQTLINQYQLYNNLWNSEKFQNLNECKNLISHCNNVKTPGLNEILKKYEASHGINKNKDKFHKMWSKGELSFFCKRPLDPQYRDYCIRDVLDLPEVHFKMMQIIPEQIQDIAFWISGMYAKQGYLSIVDNEKQL